MYNGNVYTTNAGVVAAKALLNIIASTSNAKFMGVNLSKFYLNNILKRSEYMRALIKMIFDKIIEEYNLRLHIQQEYILAQINKGIYGLT